MWEKAGTNVYIHQPTNTPLVAVRLEPDDAKIWCKLEYLNPSGSTKDRIAGYILGKALRTEKVKTGDTVVEASSGSTSIAMALACAQYGLRFIAVMPEGVSNERTKMIRAFGGRVELVPREEGIQGAISRSREIAEETGAFLPRQFENPENAEAHRRQTALEVMNQIPAGRVDAVVSGVGTGGTLVGLYQGLVDYGCSPIPVCARPTHGTAISEAECCSFSPCIPGVVEGLSEIYRTASLEDLLELEVDDQEALCTTRALIRKGFPIGPSSGLNYRAAQETARRLGHDRIILTVFPDRMERYFSTELFE